MPISSLLAPAFMSRVDKRVGKISERAFNAAVADEGRRAEGKPDGDSQQQVLRAVQADGESLPGADELRRATSAGLVECAADEQPKLTPLGKYSLSGESSGSGETGK